jgi:glutamyl-tRNA reductase
MIIQGTEQFHVFGIHHHNADISIREMFSLSEEHIAQLYKGRTIDIGGGFLILSTCNRTEIWTNQCNLEALKRHFLEHTKGDLKTFENHIFEKSGVDAIFHVFEVSSGIDSQILGDLQIQSQIKRAVKLAEENRSLNTELDRLIQIALRFSKRVKNETEISEGAASVAYAAVQYILDNSPDINSKRVLLYGTGKIGSVTCENLRKHIYEKNLVLTNRTRENAEKLAEKIGAQVKPIASLQEEMEEADIIIVATGAEHFTVDKEHFEKLSKKNRILIDLSVPRNIDPEINELESVEMADVDHLSHLQEQAMQKRRDSIPKAREILEEGMSEFMEWLNVRHLSPTFKAIKNRLEDYRKEELDFHRNKLSDTDLEKLDGITSRLMNKIARQMINHIKEKHTEPSSPVDTLSSILKISK